MGELSVRPSGSCIAALPGGAINSGRVIEAARELELPGRNSLLPTRLTDLVLGPLENVGATEDRPSAPTTRRLGTSTQTGHELLVQRRDRDPDAHLLIEERRNIGDVQVLFGF